MLHAGPVSARYVTVDDTGAHHANRNFYTTHIGREHFCLSHSAVEVATELSGELRGKYQDYVLNDAAFAILEDRQMDPALLASLKRREPPLFANQVPLLGHLAEHGVDIFDRDIIRPFAEASIWGAIRYHGLVGNAVIVSDGAGQLRVGTRALCWVHTERTAEQADARDAGPSETVRDPAQTHLALLQAAESLSTKSGRRAVHGLQVRCNRIFSISTGYFDLDKLLSRLKRSHARAIAGFGATRNAAAHQCLGKRSAWLCHKAENFGRYGQPQRSTTCFDREVAKGRRCENDRGRMQAPKAVIRAKTFPSLSSKTAHMRR